MTSILDIGCRYGIFPLFKHCYKEFAYLGVDADYDEIKRLKKKYKKFKNIKFFNTFLSNENKTVNFNIHAHHGYSTTKKINSDSIWFGKIRNKEKKILKKKKLKSFKSSDWIKSNIDDNIILKLDIEGSELDFLKGLSKDNLNKIEAIVTEAHFDQPYLTDTNFGSLFTFLRKEGYWLVNIDIDFQKVSLYSDSSDRIPICSTSIFLKKNYNPSKLILSNPEIICETLHILNLTALLIEFCKKIGFKKLKKFKIFNLLKFKIGHRFNELKNELHLSHKVLNQEFFKMFGEELPDKSDFFESDFYNPY